MLAQWDRPPLSSLFLGWAAMVPLLALSAAAWLATPGTGTSFIAGMAALWGGALLAFLAGVRRGVSFRQPGGPTRAQLAWMLVHFAIAVSALAVVLRSGIGAADGTVRSGGGAAAVLLLAAGFASLGVADGLGARQGTMPAHFARLRPAQAAVATVALLAVALRDLLA